MTSLPDKSLKLRHADLPDDFFEPDIEHYATWLGIASLQKWVVTSEGSKLRLLGRVRDKKREYTAQADLEGRKLTGSTCSCGRHRCAHVALLMMVNAAQQREMQREQGPREQVQPLAQKLEAHKGGAADARQSASQKRAMAQQQPPAKAQANPQPQRAQPQVSPPAQVASAAPEPAPARLRGWLMQVQEALGQAGLGQRSGGTGLIYQLAEYRYRNVPTLSVQIRRGDYEAGQWHDEGPFRLPYGLRFDLDNVRELPQYARADVAVLRMLATSATAGVVAGNEAYLLGAGTLSAPLLSGLLETGRLFWHGESEPLRLGPTIRTELAWEVDERGMQRLRYQIPQGLTRLPVAPPWYRKGQEVGRLESRLNASAEETLVQLPPIAPEDSAALGQALQAMFGELVPLPTPITVRRAALPYRPTLELSYRAPEVRRASSWGAQPKSHPRALARLVHHYGEGARMQARHYENGELLLLERDQVAERKAAAQLSRLGFRRLSKLLPPTQKLAAHEVNELLSLETEAQWFEFMEKGKAALEQKGFAVEVPPDFPYNLAHIEDWYGETEEKGGWFTLDLGVVVDGVRVSLLPVLVSLIASRPDLFSSAALAALDDNEVLYAALPDGRKLALPAGRVRSILSIIVELNLKALPDGPLTLPLLDAARLSQLEEALRLRWVGAERLLALGQKLRGFAGIQEVKPPQGLNADLRPYQQQGLNWLQFLRETEMGGILADDMGLGKAQPLETGVLTPLGWRKMGELQIGDFVIGQNGLPTQVTGVFPQGLRPIYRVTLTDGASVEVDDDHLWAVQTPVQKKRAQPYRTLTTRQIRADLLDAAGNLKHYLPVVEPVQFAEQALPVDPYTLGALLGDGSLTHGLGITTENELVEMLALPAGVEARHAKALTNKVSTYRLVSEGQWTANPLKDALRGLGLHGKNGHAKFVPPQYLLASAQQRLSLLQGLLDSDGHAGAVVEYSSVSEELARAVVELTQSLGGIARIRRKTTTHVYLGERKYGVCWRVTLKLPPQLDPFRLSAKLEAYRRPTKYPPTRAIKSIEWVGHKPAQCISVAAADHLYVTEAYIVTHNTLQTLAHLLLEKEAGRADLPSLVVAPTSVLHNWQAEATRFAPDLRVLVLHGPERRERFAQMGNYDLVLTTYPLLPRDLEALEQQKYHYLILDEAQNIKNAKSASAKAAGGLTARHRLVLTGTPLENHLGELWSLFNFLSPGLLHNEKVFREVYRTPIEKQGDIQRRAALGARIRPFVLRREKGEVARELPPKTEIMVPLTLEGAQRDLYETVRVTMLERVREELAAQGLSRSTIAILDALLKLRQAVTDPRLVKLQAAKGVRQNAKLQWFTEQIPQLVGDGRRILVFSAFATVLGHLEEPLKKMGIPYSKLTGQTKARHEQIEAFQSGETHVFLISLKAGGVGLNLTAADTVIHYDPWWNPAAENQATDRAYRIGQDKPVFVYKLLASGSVEERILEMQNRKAALAQGVLDGGLSDAGQLTQQDLDRLFAPLEDGEGE